MSTDSSQHPVVCTEQAKGPAAAEPKQPVFNLSTNLLFLTTWKGGEGAKASGSVRSQSPWDRDQGLGNWDRQLASLNVEIHDLNRLVNATNEKKTWELEGLS